MKRWKEISILTFILSFAVSGFATHVEFYVDEIGVYENGSGLDEKDYNDVSPIPDSNNWGMIMGVSEELFDSGNFGSDSWTWNMDAGEEWRGNPALMAFYNETSIALNGGYLYAVFKGINAPLDVNQSINLYLIGEDSNLAQVGLGDFTSYGLPGMTFFSDMDGDSAISDEIIAADIEDGFAVRLDLDTDGSVRSYWAVNLDAGFDPTDTTNYESFYDFEPTTTEAVISLGLGIFYGDGSPVPEPSTVVLMLLGFLGLGWRLKKKK